MALPTPISIQRSRGLADLMRRQSFGGPVATPLEGLGRLAQAFSANILSRRADRQEQERQAAARSTLADLLRGAPVGTVGGTMPMPSSTGLPSPAGTPVGVGPGPSAAPPPGAASVMDLVNAAQTFPELQDVLGPIIQSRLDPASMPESFETLSPEATQALGFAPGAVVQRGTRTGEIKVAQKPSDIGATKFATDLGKTLQDVEIAKRQFGEDSAQAKALQELAASERRGEPIDIKDEAGQRKEFTKESQNFVSVRDAFGRIKAAADNPSPAGDLGLMFNYMKMLDPGSTVREGEFAQIAATGAFGERLRAGAQQYLNGQRLTPAQRQDLLNQSQLAYGAQKRNQDLLEDQFTALATRSGLRPENVVIDFQGDLRGFEPATPQGAALASETRTPSGATPGTTAAGMGATSAGGPVPERPTAPRVLNFDAEGNLVE